MGNFEEAFQMEEKRKEIIMNSEYIINLERKVLGTLLTDKSVFLGTLDILSVNSFVTKAYRSLYVAINKAVSQYDSVDATFVYGLLKMGADSIEDACMTIEDIDSMTMYSYQTMDEMTEACMELKRQSERSQIEDICFKYSKKLSKTDIGELEEIKQSIVMEIESVGLDSPADNVTTSSDAVDDFIGILRKQEQGEPMGMQTGIVEIDNLGGLMSQHLVVIAGRESSGKSAMAYQMAANLGEQRIPVGYFSLEMSKGELKNREVSAMTGIPVNVLQIDFMKLSQDERQKVYQAAEKTRGRTMYFNEVATQSTEQLIAAIRMMVRKFKLRVAFIDYLQILTNNRKSRNQTEESFLGETARLFKNLAKNEDISIVLLSQVNRGADEPDRNSLRGSGQINEAADEIYILYRPYCDGKEYGGLWKTVDTENTAQMSVIKNKQGKQGTKYILGFKPEETRFYHLDGLPYKKEKVNEEKDPNRPF